MIIFIVVTVIIIINFVITIICYEPKATFGRVRQQLGEITALGLEILVVADVMESLTQTTENFSWDTLGKMVIICFPSCKIIVTFCLRPLSLYFAPLWRML